MKGLKSATVASKKPAAELLKAKAEPKKTMKKEKVEKGSKKKDADAPKRPAGAFFIFMEEFRKSFKLEFPDVKSGPAVGKAGGEKWKSLSATNPWLWIVLVLTLMVSCCNSVENYQYTQLVQMWPPGVCHITSRPCTSVPAKFTLHGLWPSNHSVKLLPCNNAYIPFSITLVQRDKKLMKKLTKYWPDLMKGKHMPFWKHEFDRHGRCMSGLNQGDQKTYFEVTLRLRKRNRLHRFLKKEGIRRSVQVSYTYTEIEDAIKKHTHQKKPTLLCDKHNFLKEIVTCYDDKGKARIDCSRVPTCSLQTIYFA